MFQLSFYKLWITEELLVNGKEVHARNPVLILNLNLGAEQAEKNAIRQPKTLMLTMKIQN